MTRPWADNKYFTVQQSNLNLADALWTAKSSNSGFSVSFIWPAQVTGSKTKRKRKRRKSKQAKCNALSASSHKEAISKPASKVPREFPSPKAEFPNNAIHPCMPTNNQHGSSQQDNDEGVEDKWTVVKRKKSHDTACVPKRLLKLRTPRHVWEKYVQQ